MLIYFKLFTNERFRTTPNHIKSSQARDSVLKFLSDAFFQAGAFSVTATFLPIKMGEAAALLLNC